MAAKIILKTHPEVGPTLGHSAKDARVIPDPANKDEVSDMRVSVSRMQQDIKEPSGGREAKVARANYGPEIKAELPSANAPRKHLTQMGMTF
ncbi:unnamed protein product [Nezara viridula]|uniref:Uncharacterized protein n=1 Tax=Nezara viridula TaxID=85310 RepID=A0A9P0EB91_NEZVI|nr:unnamed protein product [Nezara viridula]